MSFTVEKKEENFVNYAHGDASDVNVVPVRRNLVPDGTSGSAPLDESEEINGPHGDINSDAVTSQGKAEDVSSIIPPRRNLVPGGGSESDMADPSEEFSAPKKRPKVDLDENLEREALAGHMDDDDELPWAMYRGIKKEEKMPEEEDDSYDDEGIGNGETLKRNFMF